MIKKTITYDDFNGVSVTENFYFNLSKAELAEMELSQEGGMESYLQKIVAAKDGKSIIESFKWILGKTVGKRSEDGKHFQKSEQITQDFLNSNAYSELFMALITDNDQAVEFIRGIVPSDMSGKLDKNLDVVQLPASVQAELRQADPVMFGSTEPEVLTVADFTEAELVTMSADNLYLLYAGKLTNKKEAKPLTEYTRDELMHMPQTEFDKLVGTDPRKMSRLHLIIAMQRKTRSSIL